MSNPPATATTPGTSIHNPTLRQTSTHREHRPSSLRRGRWHATFPALSKAMEWALSTFSVFTKLSNMALPQGVSRLLGAL